MTDEACYINKCDAYKLNSNCTVVNVLSIYFGHKYVGETPSDRNFVTHSLKYLDSILRAVNDPPI